MAENLWALREVKRLSVATLASRAGLPIGLIMEYETGTKSIDPRHLSRLAKALYVEESEIKLRCDPRPGAGQLERQPTRPEPRPMTPPAPPTGGQPPTPAAGSGAGAPVRQRGARPPRPMSEPRPPMPLRASQLTHLNDLLGRLGRTRAEIEQEIGAPLEDLDRLAASRLLGKLQLELRTAPTRERHRAYLPEAVDQYEFRYLTQAQESGASLSFTLFNGERLEGQVAGFGPYNITVKQGDGAEVTLNKLAIVSYRKASETDTGAQL